MAIKSTDRRVRKTKLLLRNALLKLMTNKGVQAITVTELCEECDLNRGTFYLHYSDVISLLSEIEDETLSEMEEMLRDFSLLEVSNESAQSPILSIMFTFLSENADLCRVMLSANGDIAFVEKVKSLVRDKFLEEWSAKHPMENTFPLDFAFNFIVAGTMGVLQAWLANNMPISAEKMAGMVEKIIAKGAIGLAE